MKVWCLIFFLVLSAAPAFAQEASESTESQEFKDKSSTSWVPIVGYNPTYRFFGGGGFFREKKEHHSVGVHGVITQDLVLKIQLSSYTYLSPRLKSVRAESVVWPTK